MDERLIEDWSDLHGKPVEIEFSNGTTRTVGISMVIKDTQNRPMWVEAQDGKIYPATNIISFKKLF